MEVPPHEYHRYRYSPRLSTPYSLLYTLSSNNGRGTNNGTVTAIAARDFSQEEFTVFSYNCRGLVCSKYWVMILLTTREHSDSVWNYFYCCKSSKTRQAFCLIFNSVCCMPEMIKVETFSIFIAEALFHNR